jgi:hypothetical protein
MTVPVRVGVSLICGVFASLAIGCSPSATSADARPEASLADAADSSEPDALASDASMEDAPAIEDASTRPPFNPEHTFPAVDVMPGEEKLDLCQSWTLNNPEELWVNAIEMTAGPGWHHSNWMFSPQSLFVGRDGTWRCQDRGFDQAFAAAAGGVFFAQSTQSTGETQRFAPGTAFRIPPFSRVVGAIHLINASANAAQTSLRFRIHTIPAADVRTRLRPMAIDNRGIDVAARARSTSTTDCDFNGPWRTARMTPLDFRIHYILPHYHALATGMQLEVIGGPNDGRAVFMTSGRVGDPLGMILATPFDMTGATGLRLRCSYSNTTGTRIRWGENATDEMCTMLLYTDATATMGAVANSITARMPLMDGSTLVTSQCQAFVL